MGAAYGSDPLYILIPDLCNVTVVLVTTVTTLFFRSFRHHAPTRRASLVSFSPPINIPKLLIPLEYYLALLFKIPAVTAGFALIQSSPFVPQFYRC